jgi:hypothetical protein
MSTRNRIIVSLLSLAFLLFSASSAFALRCHGRIVSVGDRKYDVMVKCGEPTWVETREEIYSETYGLDLYGYGGVSGIYTDLQRVVKILIEKWTYNFGPHRLIYYLKFEDDILTEIKTGGRGYLVK